MSATTRPKDRPIGPVAVTGGAGFIGSAVMRACADRGVRAVGLVRECEVDRLPRFAESRVVDWAARESIPRALAEIAPAFVVHCAGAAARGAESSSELREANVGLVRTLLASVSESAAAAGVVILSSAAVYGPAAPTPTSEEVPLAPASDYAASKVEAESVACHFAKTAGLRVSIARPFNVLGCGEPPGSVVDVIASQILGAPRGSRTEVRVRECRSIRDYVDVDDVANALLVLAERGKPGEAYNVSSGLGVSVAELVDRAAQAWCRQVSVVSSQPDAPATISIGARERIARLGWEPARTLDETLARMGDPVSPSA